MARVESSPRRLPLSHRRAFVQRHTRLRKVDGLPGIRLHLADAVDPVWHATEETIGLDDAPIPFWAFAWAGGLALSRWLIDHPDEVAGRTVLDFATGSGLVGIVAARLGATRGSRRPRLRGVLRSSSSLGAGAVLWYHPPSRPALTPCRR